MKKITLLFLLQSILLFAQAPQKMSYQSVVRNASNQVVANQNIGVRISILEGNIDGTVVYCETNQATTNSNGLFTIEVGGGTIVSGSFPNINWGNSTHFIKSETDITGGSNYSLIGSKELLSVPYALYSSNGLPNGNAVGQMLYWNGLTWVNITPGLNNQTLTYCDGIPTWGPCPTAISLSTADSVSNLTATTARSGGTITSSGGEAITARGVVWSTSSNPTIDLATKTNDGTGTGAFISTITGLIYNTTYYVRAYATNQTGTSYGNEVTFIASNIILPTINTANASSITATTATAGGNITNSGNGTISARGVVWSTSTAPTIDLGTKTNDNEGMGSFTSNITGLNANTKYYVRAYATNEKGTAYGNQLGFTTTGIKDIDGNNYNTVVIGTQEWTKENLNVSKYRNGDIIPQVTDPTEWNNLTTGAWCYYNNDPANGEIAGKLYNWYAVNDPRGIAPVGWHVPTDNEWSNLTSYLGSSAAGKMKETGTLHWVFPNTGATNSSGFTAIPGGLRSGGGFYNTFNFYSYYWSSTQFDSLNGIFRLLQDDSAELNTGAYYDNKTQGATIRLIKN